MHVLIESEWDDAKRRCVNLSDLSYKVEHLVGGYCSPERGADFIEFIGQTLNSEADKAHTQLCLLNLLIYNY